MQGCCLMSDNLCYYVGYQYIICAKLCIINMSFFIVDIACIYIFCIMLNNYIIYFSPTVIICMHSYNYIYIFERSIIENYFCLFLFVCLLRIHILHYT